MNNAAFQLNKVRRVISTNGELIKFTKPRLNEFGEPIPNDEEVSFIKGLFHESTKHIKITKVASDGSTTRERSDPMILCLWLEANFCVKGHTFVHYHGKKYRVIEMKNLLEANVVVDISLEEEQH